jgi:hypothetical protein
MRYYDEYVGLMLNIEILDEMADTAAENNDGICT